jgi:hypothetical protein
MFEKLTARILREENLVLKRGKRVKKGCVHGAKKRDWAPLEHRLFKEAGQGQGFQVVCMGVSISVEIN